MTPSIEVIGTPITSLDPPAQIELIMNWATARQSRIVCLANAHMTVEARLNRGFGELLRRADLVTPDGMPLVWMMRRLGVPAAQRFPGVDMLTAVCRAAAARDLSVSFVGSTPEILDALRRRLAREHPSLVIAGLESPPFRALDDEEEAALVARIACPKPRIVFVSLGCPKQEQWMARNRERLGAVLIGIGGALPVYAGLRQRAPHWMRANGLEWAFRFAQEPRRLWYRYARTNPLFVALAALQLARNHRR